MKHERPDPLHHGAASTVEDLLLEARALLAAAPFKPPRREAALLLARVLGCDEAMVLARGERAIPEESQERFRGLLRRRLAGEPVAYLVGEREFYGRPFRVDRRVLIPRPETEHVVETALGLPLPARPWILDVGTGSGCLAVTLALELPGARVVATDLSPAALAVARGNAARHRVRVGFLAADLAAGLDLTCFDLVVSNPPYLAVGEGEPPSLEVAAFEPHRALFAPGHGTAVLERLVDLEQSLRPPCRMVLEIGQGQLPRLQASLRSRAWRLDGVVEDYAHIPRVVALRLDPPDGSR